MSATLNMYSEESTCARGSLAETAGQLACERFAVCQRSAVCQRLICCGAEQALLADRAVRLELSTTCVARDVRQMS